eukprot:TRINITY_DN20430_c0_g1_i1.p1 TRINITY_DN20430_c0_g1~~TRINITY_DN20430_c0_g1_i1.p1  ORF type:complete len:239 (-),score=28.22 TRINITY_DN20430_c0_g1_i1:97-771(-)
MHALQACSLILTFFTSESSDKLGSCLNEQTTDESFLLQHAAGSIEVEATTERHAYMLASNNFDVPIYNVELYHTYGSGWPAIFNEELKVPILHPHSRSEKKKITYKTGLGSRIHGDWWNYAFDVDCSDVSANFSDKKIRLQIYNDYVVVHSWWKECYLNSDDEDGVVVVEAFWEQDQGIFAGTIIPPKSGSCHAQLGPYPARRCVYDLEALCHGKCCGRDPCPR